MRKTPSSDGVLCFKSLIFLNSVRKSELTYRAKCLILLNSSRKSELTYKAKSLIFLISYRKSKLLNSPNVDCFRVCDYSLFRKLVDFFVMQLLLHAVFNRPFSNFFGHGQSAKLHCVESFAET